MSIYFVPGTPLKSKRKMRKVKRIVTDLKGLIRIKRHTEKLRQQCKTASFYSEGVCVEKEETAWGKSTHRTCLPGMWLKMRVIMGGKQTQLHGHRTQSSHWILGSSSQDTVIPIILASGPTQAPELFQTNSAQRVICAVLCFSFNISVMILGVEV